MGRSLLKAFLWAVTAVTGAVAVAMTISPEDAVSNLAKWLAFFGVDHIPEWVKAPNIDSWVTVFSIVSALAGLAAVFATFRESRSSQIRAADHEEMRRSITETAKTASAEKSADPAPTPPQPKSLKDYFESDFTNYMQRPETTAITYSDGARYEIDDRLLMDFSSRTEFLAFYIRRQTPPALERVLGSLSRQLPNILTALHKNVQITGGHTGDSTHTASGDLVFTGRVYIYHEEDLDDIQRGNIAAQFKANGASVIFRGPSYLSAKWLAEHGKAQ